MSMKEEQIQRALQIISQRRITAKQQNEERMQEIETRIPAISEINMQLARTSMEVMRIIRDGGDTRPKIEALQKQNLQAHQMVQKLLTQNGYPADYLEIHYTCEKCQDTGYCRTKFCTCLTSLAAKLATEELNRSAQFELSSFSTFSLKYYSNQRTAAGGSCYAAMERVFLFCQEYANQFTSESPSILMFGKTGLGKTHLSLAIANVVLQKGYSVLYDSAINFLLQVEKEHFGRGDGNTDTLELLLSCDLLIIDDLGTEFHTQFYQSMVYNIINTRMNRKKPTIISTNLDYDGISRQYDERVASRLFTNYTFWQFVGTDVRLLKKQEEQQKG